MTKRTLATLGISAFISASTAIGLPLTLNTEGMRLTPYYDSVGVKSWCAGETEIGYKERFTLFECLSLTNIRYGYYSMRTAEYYNSVAKEIITPKMHAAFTYMSYNVGLGAVKKSSMIRRINQGDSSGACSAILLYKKAGKIKDCSLTKGWAKGCYGVWQSRLDMNKLCMEGI